MTGRVQPGKGDASRWLTRSKPWFESGLRHLVEARDVITSERRACRGSPFVVWSDATTAGSRFAWMRSAPGSHPIRGGLSPHRGFSGRLPVMTARTRRDGRCRGSRPLALRPCLGTIRRSERARGAAALNGHPPGANGAHLSAHPRRPRSPRRPSLDPLAARRSCPRFKR